MYVYMWVCIYVCRYVCIYVGMYVYMCVCIYVCMYVFFLVLFIKHAPLQSSNTTCFILHLLLSAVGDAVTITINGFPLQFSLLHTLDILLYIISSSYRRSKFIDFINNKKILSVLI
jgi:hypothetical protein